jgi:hypothetical protein
MIFPAFSRMDPQKHPGSIPQTSRFSCDTPVLTTYSPSHDHSAKFKSNPFLLKEEHTMEQAEIEASIEAYAPFRHTIAMIKFRCMVFEYLFSTFMASWCIQREPQPAEHHYYYENEGVLGYAGRVVPPLFELSPFFSDVS